MANEHTEARAAEQVVEELDQGVDVALVSDAGLPGVSDPGQRVVSAAIAARHRVTVLPGASAPAAALVVSGLSTRRYVVEGFLPRKGRERAAALSALAAEVRTTVILESPKRLAATLDDLVEVCGGTRRAAVVRELTKLHEEIARGTLLELRERFGEAPKGELVVVLAGAEPVDVGDEEIRECLEEALSEGSSRRDAVEHVASLLGVARNRVYDLAIAMG